MSLMEKQAIMVGDQVAACAVMIVMIGLVIQCERKRTTKILFIACVFHAMALLADAIAYANELGMVELPLAVLLTIYYVAYTFSSLVLATFTFYAKAYVEERTEINPLYFYLAACFAGAAFVLNSWEILQGRVFVPVDGKVLDFMTPLRPATFLHFFVFLYLPLLIFVKYGAIGKRSVLMIGMFSTITALMMLIEINYSMIFEGLNIALIYIVLQNDLTAEKEKNREVLAKAMEEAKAADEAKSYFLFTMSHDIRTPMNAIMGYRDLLEKHQEDPIKRADYLKKIEESSEVLLSIINNVLEMARIEKGIMDVQEIAWSVEQLCNMICSVLQPLMEEKDIQFTKVIQVDHPFVYCDPAKIREILFNILSNAYKYTNAGGHIVMTLKEMPSDREGYAVIETTISDTGIGMSETFLPHLFEPFARENNTPKSKIEGTGLGMPIVKRFVELLGGNIRVTSKQGVGTTFVMTLSHKIANCSQTVQASDSEPNLKLFEGKRVLLAEDNDDNAELAMEMLREACIIVDRVADGKACFEMLEKADEDLYDAILMDIQMPIMDGYETTKAIRSMANAKKSIIPIIATTANAFEEDRCEAIAAGMNGHIAKPVNARKLMRAMAHYI